ncbi:HAD family hydrolase [Robertkochia solimangrovi]|uniref:HAD family hydrolase n=1 Tax=Robertkochia solimangrovi TaxID=2213046 RepID=UPI00118059B6|nr:HAD family phosphatase [Robertkochia solimangrovi]TRZ41063.1 HAD family phosphatase [Robertkochia solimangrovi]
MIQNIIFDFGDIFIDLDKEAYLRELRQLNTELTLSEALLQNNLLYEKGLISTEEFLAFYKQEFNTDNETLIKRIWNSIILDIPEQRLEFLQNLKSENRYRLFLLSNTNALHIEQVIHNIGTQKYDVFKSCFEGFYLSHEINMRKPDSEIYQFVLEKNGLSASESLFIDDTVENTEAASQLQMPVWNLRPGQEDITGLFAKDLPW